MIERPDLTTERLLLRRPVCADRTAIAAICGNWDVARQLGRVPHPYREADADFFLERIVPDEWVWAIVPHDTGKLVGMVGLTPDQPPGSGGVEVGYWLAPAMWGRGIMTEAARAVIAYGFAELALPFIGAGHFVRNPASGRVLAKLGFVVTGRGVRSCLAAGDEAESIELRLERSAA